MNREADEYQVLRQFGWSPDRVRLHALGNAGGMSGAALWRVETREAKLCLRRWPREHPSPDQLAWIHRQQWRAVTAGCRFVPAPFEANDRSTQVHLAGHLWELTPWMPGRADYHAQPSPAKLAAALQALAQVHRAMANRATDPMDPSPGLEVRGRRIQTLTVPRLNEWLGRVDNSHGPEIAELAQHILQTVPVCLRRAAMAIGKVRTLATPLQASLRDVWHDHVLFEGERVTGLVDYGAMRIESPMGDIARLLGSLAGNDPHVWQVGLQAYRTIQPLPEDQLRVLAAFDAANIVLSGLNWITWLFVEQRRFEHRERIEGRMREIGQRLDEFSKDRWAFAVNIDP